MTRALLLLSSVAICAQPCAAQAIATLQANDVRMVVHSNGFIGQGIGLQEPGFVVPADAGTSTLYASGLWLGGTTSAGQARAAAHLYDDDIDFFPGPLTIDGSASITPETSLAYDQLWTVTAEEIDLHHLYFECLAEPGCIDATFPDGYVIPNSILNWPAHGDFSAGQDIYLAPFYDHDSDGTYDPTSGDHPCIFGDQALFTIFNDKRGAHQLTGTPGIGVEVHMMPFAYTGNGALDQTVFVHYKLINRGTQTLTGFRIGNFADLDIGCPDDDRIGTDLGRNMVYVHNGDAIDESGCQGAVGYGAQPPAFGMVVLKGPRMDADGADNIDDPAMPAFNGMGYDDGFIDNERHGLSASAYFQRDGVTAMTDPTIGGHFTGYLRNIWKDGLPFSFGGNGHNTAGPLTLTTVVFPGSTDPQGLGTGGVPQAEWSEVSAANPPGDRRGLAIIGPITLEPGAEHDILIAYVFARTTTGGALASVTALQERVDSIADFARTVPGLLEGTACDGDATSGIHDIRPDQRELIMFPVPATNMLTVRTNDLRAGAALSVFDARGALVASIPTTGPTTTIDLTTFASGLYTVQAIAGKTKHNGRFMKE